jgi:hypothetical protein
VIVVRVGGSTTEGTQVAVRPRRRKPVPEWAWWLLLLVGGLLLLLSRALGVPGWQGLAWAVFFLALLGCVTGTVGLAVHNLRLGDQGDTEQERLPARVHRRRACKIDPELLDKLIRALGLLRKRAQQENWSVDWKHCDEHQVLADTLLASNDLPGAFRECCRAMLPLMRLFL